MSENLLEEYKAYYSVRAEKYAGNPNYANSYEAEKNLSHAMQICNKLEEFKDTIGDLNERCAIALVKDESIMEREHFKKHKEDVRILASVRILEKADECKTAFDVITLVNEVMNKNSIEISMDEAHRQLGSDWDYFDESQIYDAAVVPEKYQADMKRMAGEMRTSIQTGIQRLTADNQSWQQGWKLNPDLNLEYRHRRLLPYTEDQIKEQLGKYKSTFNF